MKRVSEVRNLNTLRSRILVPFTKLLANFPSLLGCAQYILLSNNDLGYPTYSKLKIYFDLARIF